MKTKSGQNAKHHTAAQNVDHAEKKSTPERLAAAPQNSEVSAPSIIVDPDYASQIAKYEEGARV